ncbi:hypothetical protein FDI40_gp212 [Agrobacterium phage Atu_ph07]|uniref:Uncharacterized protein n=1 Tax=Agrobacterium phage Atu_ph07 TaxID=2024264 RepID=A0A2L0UZM6_9CAUD|nr:hypothetical protein FDI40_gp212 [Agrobacterium phage Atu_ph07]AUZ94994.1 hypothetical protein [Agrobacterium phage Atu_ph07]
MIIPQPSLPLNVSCSTYSPNFVNDAKLKYDDTFEKNTV